MISLNASLDTGRVNAVIEGIQRQVIPEIMDTLISEMRIEAERRSPVGRDNERPKGQRPMKGSWSTIYKDPKKTFMSFENMQDHAPVIEFGLYPLSWTNSTRTAVLNGQRYSTQAMGGVLQPMIADNAIDERVQALFDEIMDQVING